MNSNRNKELDILKGLGIFLMVFDHIGWGTIVHTYIQSFHMPLFFIVSGYLWRDGQVTKKIARKRIKTIIVPYISFAVLYLIILYIISLYGLTDKSILLALRAVIFFPTDIQNMPFAPALWFLPCFFLCNLIYAYIQEKLGDKRKIVIITLAILGFTYSTLTDFMLPFALEPVMFTPLFMLVGECIRSNETKVSSWLDNNWVLATLVAVDICLVFINGSCDLRSARYHNCVLYLIDAINGTLICCEITRRILKYSITKLERVCQHLSIYSISFLAMNQFVIMLCEKLFKQIINNNSLIVEVCQKFVILVITLTTCFVVNELLNKSKLKFMIGR